jgi:hypothetical protein
VKRQTIEIALFLVLLLGWSTAGFAQANIDPYTTNLGLRYDFFSHSGDANSGLGFNADVTRMLGGFTQGGGWGAGGGIDIEKFSGATFKEFEGYVTAQMAATGPKQVSPFGRIGIGFNSASGATDMLLDFRGGVDFKLRPDSPFLVSTMLSIKRVFAGEAGLSFAYTVTRLSAGIVLPLEK